MDPYSLCPCGSGKKLKFCCSDLIGEIEKIHRMIEGDQPRAALRHVEQTLQKSPGRASLLDLQAMLQLSLGELESAEKTVAEFLKADPDSPSAHAHHAMVLAEREDASGAIAALQSALERVEVNLPQRVLEAIGSVGHAVLSAGDIVAARAHLWLYEAVSGEAGDHRALELLVRMNQVAGLPLLLRDRLALKSLPEGHPAAAEMRVVQQLAAAGKWRIAEAQLDEILPDHLDEPLFFYNRALLSGYLGDPKNFVAGLRLYARQQIALDDAVEAEAIAQLVDTELEDKLNSAVRVVFELKNEDTFVERMSDHAQVLPLPLSREELESFEGPKPRTYWMLLDRPEPQEVADLTREDVPQVLGFISHYGRQTDRAERVEFVTDRDERFANILDTLRQAAGDTLGEQLDEQDLGPAPGQGDPALSWRWHLPQTVPAEKRRELLQAEHRVALLERWPDSPRAALGDKTPREASSNEEMKLPLLAAILLLELGVANALQTDMFVELRDKLGLPQPESIAADSVDAGSVSIARIRRIDLSGFSNDDLMLLFKRCALVNATPTINAIIREALTRDDFDQYVPKDRLFEQLFSSEPDSNAALAVLDDARRWSAGQGQSCGAWDLLELQLYIQEGNSEGANRVLTHLRDEHMDEPDIANQVYQLLYMIGAIPENMGAGGPHSIPSSAVADAAPAAESSSAIWTPGGESGSTGKSKLWTPD
ncbi:tetratricopeptide repeat protein [Aeoliella mucimassa]|uniref:Uncharacterized protein n=1 Tax=Aeoliella mucimassa TaxID=2527972 RepID=A0A518AGS9_9BACT|nr:tetratricopeptide repeat protein [Aeoliella mucimassa]QDU53943.1 hypothetical protein Pan181_01220 [Aeoliella mucimassa]